VSFKSEFWELNGVTVNPKPLQQPRAPIWIGGHARPALVRAVKFADAWMGAGASTIADFKDQISFVRDLLDKEGRDPAEFPISKRIFLGIGPDRESVGRKVRQWFGEYYHDSDLADRVAVYGPVDHVIEELASVVEEDLDMLMLNPVYDPTEQTHILAEEILPKL
jgi:alkanesulfonate monooxygenase SsuD/methylene tetrahydromethanopterin reductase-like flavin-dependent oxidoreductase (luciferase family)